MISKLLFYIEEHIVYILILVSALVFIKLFLIAHNFIKSDYSIISGNSLLKTVKSKRKWREYSIFALLKKLPGENKLLTDMYLPRADGDTSKIDLILIHETGIYVFDSMNVRGWIFGNEKSRAWKKAFFGILESMFPNPIWQNMSHISALTNILKDVDKDKLYSYLVFDKHCKLKIIKFTLKNMSVLRINYLPAKLIHHFSQRESIFSDDKMDELYTLLKKYSYDNKMSIKQHIEDIKKI